MSSLPHPRYTPAEYLSLERKAEFRSEYIDGQIVAMAGASETHNVIAGNTFANLHVQLRKRKCKVYQNDLRVRVGEWLYTYPDVVVVCGKAQFEDDRTDTLLNPTLIVEVLSATTEKYDRGEKFKRYRTVESLQEYILVSQEDVCLERFVRQSNGNWILTEFNRLEETVAFDSIECSLTLADVYEKVEFSPNVSQADEATL